MTGAVAGPLSLAELERCAARRGLLLRIQRRRQLGIWALRVGVARSRPEQAPQLLGELKGWALPAASGLHLDTLRVQGRAHRVGVLIWAATFAWALEETPCRRAQLLAIHDEEVQHCRLVRYFERLGFQPVQTVGAGLLDWPQRLLWGGAGLRMAGDCQEGLRRCSALLVEASAR
ncbi:hypothetical protein KQ313_11375 [Synechococcus sp. CS-1325]|uniref:hypothetical protein n=1 Tax=unclassified Synechococcus TaxID=2626047 RepID=UPI000DB0CB90|nr:MULTISPECIES: hypothetical protein [unclassified Synechococcus]MCT0200280.1 hypothetical protein [Synechococcus sp. CS-1325]MCT0214293.1 hypothetical protein [Synechococcus sp. CS-1326]MCT0234457.1 hypothetical protein [Synechococcus sp. CS-1327]PZV01591.1 MAG: hypothetical protein DCF24_03880 [Cyanobium sp.]